MSDAILDGFVAFIAIQTFWMAAMLYRLSCAVEQAAAAIREGERDD